MGRYEGAWRRLVAAGVAAVALAAGLPGAADAPPRVATNAIHMDAAHPTALVLPVVYPAE